MTATASSPEPVLSIADLSVDFRVNKAWVPATRSVSFELYPGEILAVVGESGSGKSVSSMSVLDLLADSARTSGRIRLGDADLLPVPETGLGAVRGNEVAMIFQEPMTALNPVYSVGQQIIEAIRCHTDMDKRAARERAIELLELVGFPEPGKRVDYHPHQLSGGQRQRAMIAMAISCDPKVLIADEPTTALDVTVQAEILDLLRDLRKRLNSAIVLITHDMGVVAELADRVVVMRSGEVIEQSDVYTLFAEPEHEYTRKLLAAVPHLGRAARSEPVDPPPAAHQEPAVALRLDNTVVRYRGRFGRPGFLAVNGVSLELRAGEVMGLVGESGSGKSTIGRCAMGLLRAESGTVEVCGEDITRASERRLRALRRRFSMVFQDPASSLNPRARIGDSIGLPLRLHRVASGRELTQRVGDLLEQVELPRSWASRYPHELSGGQRQRVGIARAIALEPELLVADEPTSALDVSVQATVLNLFLELQSRLGFSCLFISHDLAVVEMLANTITVLRDGQIVESGDRARILTEPAEEYTRQLVRAAPVPDPVGQRARRR
ncbi:peptide/nickel transport system ATP-binding protein [Tamaricihabitans halophyticus]|uniref:Peptide/nickel transport system ATP-binding protein n=1 Tax=Tamaricihabitans halophyticus TaxID=1262583 RepID=A0A4R2QSY6_9PSEU|nr:ABC transporter ATP-binding protein [Tamaricihabitans halophyticus]TCP53023.1 peptide/nickel transport system ATP-binding protein [Tamaricihabitans halophyticus]